ncbi:MAG: metallopeptidase TldD-related protein [Candidatus Eremiobacterota bacterium]
MFGSKKIDRRDFLKTGGILLATASLGGITVNPYRVMADNVSSDDFLSEKDISDILSIAMKKNGDFGEIYFENSRESSIRLQDGKIQSTQIGYSKGVGIRVLSGERTGYAYSDDLSLKSLSAAAEVASNIASGTGSDKAYSVTPQTVPDYYSIKMYPDQVEISKKLELIKRANEAAFGMDKRIKKVRAGYSETAKDIMIAHSEGKIFKDKQNNILFWVMVVAEENGKKESIFYGDGGCVGFEFFDRVTPESIVEIAVKRALVNLNAEPAPAGPMEVVIASPYGGILLHEAIGHGMEADFNRKNLSAFSGRLGQKVAEEFVNIYDDGTITPAQNGTINIDDEGNASNKTVLVERGILKNYMQDRLNAGLMGMKVTGNGRRESFKYAPIPRMTNTVMANASTPTEEIISSVKKGFYAKAMTNGQVDISAGDFMFYVDEGYIIENGKIGKPVKGATLIGNGLDVLSKITMVGNDFSLAPSFFTCGKDGQSVPVGFGIPTIKISEITVGGTNFKG